MLLTPLHQIIKINKTFGAIVYKYWWVWMFGPTQCLCSLTLWHTCCCSLQILTIDMHLQYLHKIRSDPGHWHLVTVSRAIWIFRSFWWVESTFCLYLYQYFKAEFLKDCIKSSMILKLQGWRMCRYTNNAVNSGQGHKSLCLGQCLAICVLRSGS